MKNEFGGSWTERKVIILEKYVHAYLKIMNNKNFHLTYFDGFAGSGDIKIGKKESFKVIAGAGKRIIQITDPIGFDIYYFVEKNENKRLQLDADLKATRNDENIFTVTDDCNDALLRFSAFISSTKKRRGLAFLDPFGMNLDWNTLESLKGLGVDLWILCPTGVGANRLLKRDSDISDAWWERLERFFGIGRNDIANSIYQEYTNTNLFGEESLATVKASKANQKLFEIYKNKMLSIFDFVSEPYIMVNKNKSIMYHFFCASNNATAVKLANSIMGSAIKK
ncbi:three-Cys-motif partner protein TcmP [Pedobacter endophyticus]|uniref:Three-Cys-motif partner protein TcmP n=1 Tax=Pedobacter endophyticus TaxID=2789740 RepID=A0A7U3SQB0_9SPHI|nr:three-Cys-motif partner protein TcmP [Pedobacter endophyticus]QPH38749.1 three-Cys-motif partner protein TcmP [Pedobacter endophyticus]